MTQNANLHPDLGTFAQWYGIPVNVAPPPTTSVTPTFIYNTESDHPAEGYPIDQSTFIEGGPSAPSGSDRHALVVNKNLCKLYEIYNLQNFTNGQTPAAGSGAVWDLNSDAMRPDGWTSADAAGLPMTPLLLRPDEILAGSITHAIRFTTHCTNGYIWPGSHNAGLCSSGFPPMGARFRLRSSFNISSYSATTQVVLRAFQHYGLMLADNGSDWFFGGTTDDWWGTTAGSTVVSELKTIPASQFDAVDESGLQSAPGSYRAAVYNAGWKSAGGYLTSGPGAAGSAAGEDAFVRGSDNALWQAHFTSGAFTQWAPRGGVLTSDPAAVATSSTRNDVFVRGSDNALWQGTWNGSTWTWTRLGGTLISGPGADARTGGLFDAFVAGTDHALWVNSFDGTSWTWTSLGGVVTSDPAAVASGSTQIDVVVGGTDRGLWHRKWIQGAGWGAWDSVGGVIGSSPAVASCTAGHFDVYVLGTDRSLFHRGWNGSAWSAWQRLGGTWTAAPAAVCQPGSTTLVDIFERGTDGALWYGLTVSAS